MRISSYLTAHKDEIWAAPSTSSMKSLTLNLLEAEELKDNPDIDSAKKAIERCKTDSQFYSTLTTLMTNIKCSDTRSMRDNRKESEE